MDLTQKSRSAKFARSLTALALAGVAVVATATAGSATSTVLTLTPSTSTGPVGGGNTLVLTLTVTGTTTATNKFGAGSTVQFQNLAAATPATTCNATPLTSGNLYVNPANTTDFRIITNVRATVKVPALTTPTAGGGGVAGTSGWFICAYNSANENIGKASYTTASAPTITTLGASSGSLSAITGFNSSTSAVSGPSTGGTELAIHGTNLPTTLGSGNSILLGATTTTAFTSNGAANGTVTGGTAVTTIKSSPAPTATDITVVLPAKVGAGQSITVVTLGGSYTVGYAFTSINGIVVSPSSVVRGSSVDVDITGAGFLGSAYSFSNTGSASTGLGTVSGQDDATSHVFLVAGVYDPTGYISKAAYDADQLLSTPTGLVVTAKTNGQVAECVDVFVISDTELICTVNSAKKVTFNATANAGYGYTAGNLPLGAYTITIVDKADTTMVPTNRTAVSAGSTFTVGQF